MNIDRLLSNVNCFPAATYQGLDQKLVGVEVPAHVVKGILA